MIVGIVNEKLQAVIRLPLRGESGVSHQVETVLDTGFNGALMLPHALFETLKVEPETDIVVQLADGSNTVMNVYVILVDWDGEAREVSVLEAEGDALLGMALLENQRVTMEVRAGGRIGIEALA